MQNTNYLAKSQTIKTSRGIEYNNVNPPNLPSDNNKEDISLVASNNGDKKIKPRLANTTGSNNRDIMSVDTNKRQ